MSGAVLLGRLGWFDAVAHRAHPAPVEPPREADPPWDAQVNGQGIGNRARVRGSHTSNLRPPLAPCNPADRSRPISPETFPRPHWPEPRLRGPRALPDPQPPRRVRPRFHVR